MTPLVAHGPHHDQPGMNPQPDSQGAACAVWEPRMQVVQRSEDTKASAYSALGIVLMGLGVAKVHQQSIP